MKKLYTLLFLTVASVSFAQTFYSENMGTPSATTPIASNIFQNASPIVYSGTADVRSSLVSGGYSGASAGGNVFINAIDEYFQIDGINTSAYNTANIRLSFGVNTPTAVTNLLVVEVSTNAGTTWSPITYTPSAISWSLVTLPGGLIPSSSTLSIRFKSTSILQYRIDDVKLSNVSASCTLSLGTPTTLCDASTLNLDTYTVTIPYDGGANAVYTVTPSSGTVGGDNPSTVAAGNITVSGVAEGTNFTAIITGGTCNLDTSASSPECKPINALPYSEDFGYTVGTSLASTQKWSNSNSGDTVDVVSGSLNYANYPSSGNAVSYTGAGSDPSTKFTVTTAGTIYSSFLINISDMTGVTTDLSETVIAALSGDSPSSFRARLFFKKNGTQYQLGCTSATGVPASTIYDATLFNTGTTVAVVLGYDFGTNEVKMWLNPNFATFTSATPANITEVPATALTNIGSFILRQDTNLLTPTVLFDGLRVAETTTALLSVAQNSIKGLKVYPNPVSNGTLFVETAANAERVVTIYNVIGKQVLNTTTSDATINVSSLQAGLYIVKITEEGNTATRKLIIE
jgi:hypothetical protein